MNTWCNPMLVDCWADGLFAIWSGRGLLVFGGILLVSICAEWARRRREWRQYK
jgi:hypothetical protein